MSRTRIVQAIAFLLAACLFSYGAESDRDHTVVLKAGPMVQGESFACRIRIMVHHKGSPELEQVNVVAEVLSGDAVLGKTGLASGRRPIVKSRDEEGVDYEPVPVQFELTPDLCRQADGLRVSFARCVFGDQPATNCIDRMRFAQAREGDPLLLPLKKPAPESG